ncbi:hypothetical protein BYT27DRAFT_7265063 [Phlegmacium glaucopus]|nr:hypothetical protein BYT27DRAFT_7265063 [Phlegmacium glaucopus]
MKWEPATVKAELRLASQKLGQLQARYDSQATIMRADIATLIQQGNIPLARDKAEKLMQDEAFGDLLEELGMQVGLLLEHSRELEYGPLSHIAMQAASNIIYATPYVYTKDLDVIRDYLVSCFGSDFANSAAKNRYHHVSSPILRSTSTSIPSAFKLDNYLQDVASAYGVDWSPEPRRQEIVNHLSELLDPDATTAVNLPQLQKLCSRGIPDEPSWLRPRIWKLFFGTLPKAKASWKSGMTTQREAYYDLVRQLLGPFSPPSQSSNPILLDNTLRAAYKQLYGLPRDFYVMLQDEPESFGQCPLNEGGRDEAIARMLESRLLILDDRSKYGSDLSPTPEIRLELHPWGTPGSDTPTADGLTTSTTLTPSRKCMFGYAHPKHCSALLRLLYFHMTINPGNISPHLSSFLVPLYSVLMQEVDPEDLAHVEADTFWLFEAMLAELLGLEDNSGKVWMTKLSERLAWGDNDLFVHLQARGLDPILPYYSYRWLMPMLTHTLPLSSVFLVWDAIFSCQARDRSSNPKLDFFLDVCASMIIRAKTALYRLGDVKQKGPSLWIANANQLSYSTGPAEQVEDTLLEGISLLQPYNLSKVGGIERVLQMAFDLSQRRNRELISRQANPSLRDRFRVGMWKEFTSQRVPSNEGPANSRNGTDGKDQDPPAALGNSSLVSQITNTVWKGITNQTAMESPSTPPSPTFPIQIPQPEADPQTTPNLWNYAEKLKGSDTIATLSKMSSNWRARALLGSSFSGSPQPTSIAGIEKGSDDHLMPSSGSYEKQDSSRTSSLYPMPTPNPPLETALEGSSQHSDWSIIERTRSLLSPTRSPPPLAPKSAPRPLLLTSTLLTSSQNGLKSHRNLINSTNTTDTEEWADVMREKQHYIYRDSVSSASSLSPSDAYVRTPKSTKSDRESDTSSSRIVSLNRRSVSPMAPSFRLAHGRLPLRNSSTPSEFPSPPILPQSPLQTTHSRVTSVSPTILETYPPPSDRHASRIAAFEPKESDSSDTASNEQSSSIMRLASSQPESKDAELSIKASRVRSKRYPRPTNLHIQDGQKSHASAEEKNSNSSQLSVEWPRDETEIVSTPKRSRFESEEYTSMPRKLSRSPLRSKKLSTGEIERQRKASMDTIKDTRQRKVSSGHRHRKISTESRETPKNRHDSSAEEGDDEGYDELLSAYESEDGPKSSSVF